MLKDFAEHYPQLQEEPIWVTVPSRQALGRFQELPPTEDKKISAIIEKEAATRFPVAVDQLSWQSWTQPKGDDIMAGRYCAIIAVRDFVVAQKSAMFVECGLKIEGLQVEAVAVANLIDHEFSDDIEGSEDQSQPAVGIVDVGSGSTAIVCCSRRGFWFRSFDVAGDTFSRKMVSHLKITHAKADSLKVNIADHRPLAPLYKELDEPFGKFQHRFNQLLEVGESEIGKLNFKSFWITGGGGQLHGFVQKGFAKSS